MLSGACRKFANAMCCCYILAIDIHAFCHTLHVQLDSFSVWLTINSTQDSEPLPTPALDNPSQPLVLPRPLRQQAVSSAAAPQIPPRAQASALVDSALTTTPRSPSARALPCLDPATAPPRASVNLPQLQRPVLQAASLAVVDSAQATQPVLALVRLPLQLDLSEILREPRAWLSSLTQRRRQTAACLRSRTSRFRTLTRNSLPRN